MRVATYTRISTSCPLGRRESLYEEGPVSTSKPRGCSRLDGGWRSHLSIASLKKDQARSGTRSGSAISHEGRHATRDSRAPAGAKGWLRVSMCQIASARKRATSTRATLGPRCLPSRLLLRS